MKRGHQHSRARGHALSSSAYVGATILVHDRELVDPLEPRQGRTRVHVPFMYDLGGRVKNIDGLRHALVELYGSVEVDQAATRSWNLSYLAGHTPVVRCRLTEGSTQFADSECVTKEFSQDLPLARRTINRLLI
jgi:hypothetical protein